MWYYVKKNKELGSKINVWINFIRKIRIMVYIDKPKYVKARLDGALKNLG